MCSCRCLTIVLCALGAALSAYTIHVEIMLQIDPEYKPLCDLHETVSCSIAFNSTWAKGMGVVGPILGEDHWFNVPNALYGLVFYALVAVVAVCRVTFIARLQFWLCVFSNVCSVYLGYILYAVLHDLCVVCVLTYAINFLLLITSLVNLRRVRAAAAAHHAAKRNQWESERLVLPSTNPTYFKKNI